jgi:hypothetical protein
LSGLMIGKGKVGVCAAVLPMVKNTKKSKMPRAVGLSQLLCCTVIVVLALL